MKRPIKLPRPAPAARPAPDPRVLLLLAELRALAAIMPGIPAGPVPAEADEADFDNMPV